MAKAIASPAALADWLVMLDGIEKSVTVALADVERRAPEENGDNGVAADRDAALRSRLDETIRGLEQRLTAARTLAARVEAMLDSDEQMVRAWRQTAESRASAWPRRPDYDNRVHRGHFFRGGAGSRRSAMGAFAVLIPAAGRSTRFNDKEKKPFATLDGRAVWLRTAELFVNRNDVAECLLIISADDEERFRTRYAANLAFMNVKLVHGGRERFESVANGLAKMSPGVEFVAVHDAVRPCVTNEQIDAVFAAAKQHGAAILAARLSDTLKRVEGQFIRETPSREGLWLAQTPQVFRRDVIEAAYARRASLGDAITDDAQLVEAMGLKVAVVEGTATNIKITTKDDLALAAAILTSRPAPKEKRPFHPFAEEEMWK